MEESFDAFWANVAIAGDDECWPWKGVRNRRGYGHWKSEGAHRVAFRSANRREIAPRAYICHHCDNPSCCNPKHLYEGDALTNARDFHQRGSPRPRRIIVVSDEWLAQYFAPSKAKRRARRNP